MPFTSFSENALLLDGSRPPASLALDEIQPLAFLAGIWPRSTPVRKVRKGETTNDLLAFLTTERNAVVAPSQARERSRTFSRGFPTPYKIVKSPSV